MSHHAPKPEIQHDPITRRADDSYADVAQAFGEMLAVLDEIVSALGGSMAARAVVTRAAREAAGNAKSQVLNRENGLWRLAFHLPFCEPFVIGADGFRLIGQILKDSFRVRSEAPVALSASFLAGAVTIRGDRMCFETATAAVLLGHCYQGSGIRLNHPGDERWSTAITDEAEILLDLSGFEKPRVQMTHSKSQAAATKGLVRVAAECFKVKLQAPGESPGSDS